MCSWATEHLRDSLVDKGVQQKNVQGGGEVGT